MGEDGLVVLREDGSSLGKTPDGAEEAEMHSPPIGSVPLYPHVAGSVLCSSLKLPELCSGARGRTLGRPEQFPNPALNPTSLQSWYLKQTIAMITTTMTNSSAAVAEPTIRGSSWKVLLVEPDRDTGIKVELGKEHM